MEKSLSRMCNFRIEDRDNQNFREICTIPFDECNNLYEDYVIFGHLAFKVPFIHRRYIGIDTGAVYGNMLSAVFFER